MPKSRGRKKDSVQTPTAGPASPGPSPVWLVPAMLVLFAIGVVWLVVYYVSGGQVPGMRDLGPWNLAIGFGFIVVGFGLATQWR